MYPDRQAIGDADVEAVGGKKLRCTVLVAKEASENPEIASDHTRIASWLITVSLLLSGRRVRPIRYGKRYGASADRPAQRTGVRSDKRHLLGSGWAIEGEQPEIVHSTLYIREHTPRSTRCTTRIRSSSRTLTAQISTIATRATNVGSTATIILGSII